MANDLKVAIFADYDGTITVEDTVDSVLDAFGAPDWREVSERLDAAGATNVERMTAEFAHLGASRRQIRDFIRENVHIDDTFKDFLEYVRKRGWRFVIVSQGLKDSVETVFDKYAVDGLEWHSNTVGGPDGDLHLEFPERGAIDDGECNDLCGVCKAGYIRQARREGYATVFVGDGITDRCPAETADVVFAKGYLQGYLTEKRIPFQPFKTFEEIKESLEGLFPAGEVAADG